MSLDPAADLRRLRAIALALPHADEKLSHGAPVFFIAKGRTFAWFMNDHHGSGITAVLVRTGGPDEQMMLIEADPALYYRPPYLGPAGWVGIRVDAAGTDWDHVAARVAASWRLAATPRMREALPA